MKRRGRVLSSLGRADKDWRVKEATCAGMEPRSWVEYRRDFPNADPSVSGVRLHGHMLRCSWRPQMVLKGLSWLLKEAPENPHFGDTKVMYY